MRYIGNICTCNPLVVSKVIISCSIQVNRELLFMQAHQNYDIQLTVSAVVTIWRKDRRAPDVH